jgi:hypothetical protein
LEEGVARTDLVEAALRGEDGDVPVVPRARAAAHHAGRRKMSPELGGVSEQGEDVWALERLQTPQLLLIPQEEESPAHLASTRTLTLRRPWPRPAQK